MTIEEQFVRELKQAVIDDNLGRYLRFVNEMDTNELKNEDWLHFITALRKSGATECSFTVFRHIIVDVVANVLGILDGSSNLSTMRGDFQVVYEGQSLDPTLSEVFWESEQQ